MSIKLDRNSRQAVVKIRSLKKLTKRGMEFAGYTSGRGLVKATSDQILAKPKGGRTYVSRTRSGSRSRHVASATGETHANFSGKLRRALDFKVSTKQLEFGYGVTKGNAPDYASFVEFGTFKMGPRPSLQNGIKSQTRNIEKNFEREIGKRIG